MKEMEQPYYRELRSFLINEYRTASVFPGMYDIFNALHYTSLADTKVVIIGQDPYHGDGQAHGLSFSVLPDVPPPPSLLNIYKELSTDLGCRIPDNGYLKPWADQGVLLLNTVLTVRRGAANSHAAWGWQRFSDAVLSAVDALPQPIAYVLWGGQAQKKAALLQNSAVPRLVLSAPHPSPLSAYRGFFGSRPFSKINAFLTQNEQPPIDWSLY